jgi:E3 ubiquitin-protein ligase MYCBP2
VPKGLQDICEEKECQQKAANACQKVLPCNHSCGGYKDEAKCLECFTENCGEINEIAL